jgi:hypothetical protein
MLAPVPEAVLLTSHGSIQVIVDKRLYADQTRGR